MTRRGWTWSVVLLVLGVAFTATSAGAIASYTPPAGSQQSLTLGQLAGLIVGVVLLVAGAVTAGSGLRRHRAAARRRRLRDEPAGREQG